MTAVPARTERDEHCDALQKLVDLLRAHPEIESPFLPSIMHSLVCSEDKKGQLAAWARATSHLNPKKDYNGSFATLTIDFGGDLRVEVFTARQDVCERIVVGTETVTKTVKDPEALKAVPEVEVTEERDIVEWRCAPLLAVDEQVA